MRARPFHYPSPGSGPCLAPGTALKPRENAHLSWGHLFLSSLPSLVLCGETILLPSPSSLLLAVTGWVSHGHSLSAWALPPPRFQPWPQWMGDAPPCICSEAWGLVGGINSRHSQSPVSAQETEIRVNMCSETQLTTAGLWSTQHLLDAPIAVWCLGGWSLVAAHFTDEGGPG